MCFGEIVDQSLEAYAERGNYCFSCDAEMDSHVDTHEKVKSILKIRLL